MTALPSLQASQSKSLNSRIARGTLRHRRFTPILREFQHDVTYFFLELSEIKTVFRIPGIFTHRFPGIFRFNSKIYFEGKTGVLLDTALRNQIEKVLNFRPDGPIYVLTQISSFGIGFNPVSFYFFYSANTGLLEAILSEITNTPWNERHATVHDCRDQGERGAKRFSFQKDFHVSPFLGMNYDYDWSFLVDRKEAAEKIHIQMNNLSRKPLVADTDLTSEKHRKHFDATLSLSLEPMTGRNITATLLSSPAMVLKTILLIYAHALILFVRKVPFFSHPNLKTQLKTHNKEKST